MSTSRVEGYRNQFRTVRGLLEGTINGMTNDQFNYQPGGTASSPGGNYLHHVQGMDVMVIGKLQGKKPLIESTDASQVGQYAQPHESDWCGWARSTTFDIDAAQAYGNADYETVDNWLAGLTDDDLEVPVDLSSWGRGDQPSWFLLDLYVIGGAGHMGEISSCKGTQGLKGYPV